MFINRKSIIQIFQVICIVFVCCMFYVFVKVLYTNEKTNTEIDKFEDSLINTSPVDMFKGSNMFFYDFLDVTDSYEGIPEGKCYSQYIAYYLFALVLGAYVNVKRLYKMGPI